MSSNLEIRLCELKKRVVGGVEEHTLGVIQPNANTDSIINGIANLQFNGPAISSDVTSLGETIQLATGGGFPSAAEVIVIGAIDGLSGADQKVAADRAIAVKDFLLHNGVPARNVAVEIPLNHTLTPAPARQAVAV